MQVVAQIADRTDGVPLFIEELTKSLLESGVLREEGGQMALNRALPPSLIPTSLHDLLMARLDRLASVRHVAQIGAAIGRRFSYVLLRAVSGLPDDELEAALDRLVASELVIQRGAPPHASYTFKHALVQDAAHGSLLRSTRHLLHAKIATALESHYPELMESQPELFAQHYAEAGLVEKSVAYWGKAGRRSAARSAMAEAVAQLQKGLDQLALLPETPERQRQELEFWSDLGAALRFVRGQATQEMGHAFARARELWEKLGSPPEFHHIPYGQSFYHMYRGEFDLAQRLDEDLLRLAGSVTTWPGSFSVTSSVGPDADVCRPVSAAEIASGSRYSRCMTRWLTPHFCGQTGSHPRVGARGQLGIALSVPRFSGPGSGPRQRGIAEATTLGHAPSLAASLAMEPGLLRAGRQRCRLGPAWPNQLIAVATEQGFPMYSGAGDDLSRAQPMPERRGREGISLLRSGASAYSATGAETRISYHVGAAGQACEIAGEVEEALSLAGECRGGAERIGERWFAAELHRRKGQLMLQRGDARGRGRSLPSRHWRSPREQEARLWQLRAAANLARLYRDRGRRAEAYRASRSGLSMVHRGF